VLKHFGLWGCGSSVMVVMTFSPEVLPTTALTVLRSRAEPMTALPIRRAERAPRFGFRWVVGDDSISDGRGKNLVLGVSSVVCYDPTAREAVRALLDNCGD